MLKKNLGYFVLNTWLTVRTRSTYRAATVLKLCVNLFITVLYIYLWKAVYAGKEMLNGFALPDMLAYVFLLRVFRNLYPHGVSGSYGNLIRSGGIATALLRPMRIELQLLSEAAGSAIYDFCFCGLPSLLLFRVFVPASPLSATALPAVFFWFFGSCTFVFLLELTIGTFAYYTQNLWGLGVFKGTMISFLSGELLPIHFYPARPLALFEWLPFASMYYVPILLFLGKTVEDIGLYSAVLWGSNLLLLLIYSLLAKRMIRHITVQGG
ncbi:MAG: ABC-2 family transporter protein [Lachnospiraceae bacterium]|nr:ABC-2 family transporter protein [Lachnospiraceae bacterium]